MSRSDILRLDVDNILHKEGGKGAEGEEYVKRYCNLEGNGKRFKVK